MAQNNVNYNTMYGIGICLKSTSAVFVKYRFPVTYIMVDKLGHIHDFKVALGRKKTSKQT